MIKRVSGIGIASVAAILALTGYALYYTTDRLHDVAGTVHEVLGGAAILLALAHWRPHRRARRSRLSRGKPQGRRGPIPATLPTQGRDSVHARFTA